MGIPDFTLWNRYVEITGKRPCIESEEHTEEQSCCTYHYVEWLEKQVAQLEKERAELVGMLKILKVYFVTSCKWHGDFHRVKGTELISWDDDAKRFASLLRKYRHVGDVAREK